MDRLRKPQTLVVLSLTLALGLAIIYFYARSHPVDFRALPGLYECDDLGIPEASYTRLRITPEMRVEALSGADEQGFPVGRLAPRDNGARAELEYTMEIVHHAAFQLDPFTAPQIQGYRNSLTFKARRADAEFVRSCRRL